MRSLVKSTPIIAVLFLAASTPARAAGVTLSANAKLTVASATQVTMTQDFTNSGTLDVSTTGVLKFTGSHDQTVNMGATASVTLGTVSSDKSGGILTFGTNAFTATTLSITTAHTVKFESGKRFAATNLTLTGASAASRLVLRGTSSFPWEYWKLRHFTGGTQNVAYVDVSQSNANPREDETDPDRRIIDATTGSLDSGNNINWDFGVAPTLVEATTASPTFSVIYLRFDQPMDKPTATNVSNYAASTSGSPHTISAAEFVSDLDRKVVKLTLTSNVTAGTTTVTASTAVKSLVQRPLAAAATKTVVAGNVDGFSDADAVVLQLSTDTTNKSIIQMSKVPGFDHPKPGAQFTLGVIAPGTTATEVTLAQVLEPGGTSKFFFGSLATATAEFASDTTSGVIDGSLNRFTIQVSARDGDAMTGDRLNDTTIRAYLKIGGVLKERGIKLTTVVKLDIPVVQPYMVDQRPVTQTLTTIPPIAGLQIISRAFLAPDGDHVNPNASTLIVPPAWPSTDASGTSMRGFMPAGMNSHSVGSNQTNAAKSNASDPDDNERFYTVDDPFERECKCCKKKDRFSPGSVDLTDGEEKIGLNLLSVKGRGMDFALTANYRSAFYRKRIHDLGVKIPRDFGEGWAFSYADDFLVKDTAAGVNDANYAHFHDDLQAGDLWMNTGSGVWTAPIQVFAQLRKYPVSHLTNPNDFELREADGTVKIYQGFGSTATPNQNGRLMEIRDRNGNRMTFHYRKIDPNNNDGDEDPDTAPDGDEKFILAFAVDTMGREIRYQYYAPGDPQVRSGRTVTVTSTNAGAYGRLATVKDFKGNMDYTGSAESEDFAGQVNNRTVTFDYDSEGNLERVSEPAVAGTPHGNDFSAGRTTRYKYITNANRGGLTQAQWDALSASEKDRLLHKLTHVWRPNEVKGSPTANPSDAEASSVIAYQTDKTNPFFGFAVSHTYGGTNGYGVPSGGTVSYAWEDLDASRQVPISEGRVILNQLDRLFLRPVLKATATDRNGNGGEFTVGGGKTHIGYKEMTRGLRSSEPASFDYSYEPTKELLHCCTGPKPKGNEEHYQYFEGSADRFQQGNLVRMLQDPASLTSDQALLETVYISEPIYQQNHMTVSPRGVDEDFVAPIAEPSGTSRTMTDPYDPTNTRELDLRYAVTNYFDYQESTEKAYQAPGSRLDLDGSGGQVNQSVLASDTSVFTVEVWMIQILGLPEDSGGLTTLRNRLKVDPDASVPVIKLGLGDLNGDGVETLSVAGNVVRTVWGSPVLIPNLNQTKLEDEIETAGDLVDEMKTAANGGPGEGSANAKKLQTVVRMYQYNALGQVTKEITPEANAHVYAYFAETDPDGDGQSTPSPADSRTLDSATGGYLRGTVRDTTRPSGAISDNKTNPTITSIAASFTYDDVGNTVTSVNGRGIRDDFFVNELGETVQTKRAAGIADAAAASPSDPLYDHSDTSLKLTAFAYKSRTYFDYNGNAVRIQIEDRGNTSSVDGSGIDPLPSQLTDTTPGAANSSADPSGGEAYQDTIRLYDRLDDLIEECVEVDGTRGLKTRHRYDPNQNRVMTIHPEGNAESWQYDERDLLFKHVRGATSRPSAGLFAAGDPTSFNRTGGSGTTASTATYNYDKNGNLDEFVDAGDTDSNSSNNSSRSGSGDKTAYTYDGFDRRDSVVDPDGNTTLYDYDPDSNVVREVVNGDPVNDEIGTTGNQTLQATEYVHDELSRVVVTHRVLFLTPDVTTNRTIISSDTSAMDSLAAYLPDASSDTASATGMSGISILGRVSTITEYDRESRGTFVVEDDLDNRRADYDGAGRVVKTTDSALATGFDGTKFLPANLSGNVVETAYDDNDNPIESLETDVATIGGLNNETFRRTMLHDSLDRLQTEVDPLGHTMDYRYDSRGNLRAKADAQGPVASRTVARRGLGSSSAVTVNGFGNACQYSLDGVSRQTKERCVLTSTGQGNGTDIWATIEGVLSSPTADTNQGGGDGFVDVIQAWDDNSKLKSLTDDQGNQTQYTYDNIDRKKEAKYGVSVSPTLANRDDADKSDVWTYDVDHNVATFTDQNGTVSTNAFDALNRLKQVNVTVASGTGDGGVPFVVVGSSGTAANSYKYDGLSRRTEATDVNFIGDATDDSVATWAFDSLSRTVEESQKIGTLSTKFVSCFYDINTSGSESDCSSMVYPDGRQVNCTYDRLDRLATRGDAGYSPIATYDYVGTYRVLKRTLQNSVNLDLTVASGTQYDGDRRPLEWRHKSASTTVVGFGYKDGNGDPAYDRMDNKKIEEKFHDSGVDSEVYVYDSIYRLRRPGSTYRAPAHAFRRGTLNSAKDDITTLTSTAPVLKTMDWGLDGVGNWESNTTAFVSGGFTGGTQNRFDTSYNEYAQVGGSSLGSGGVAQDNDHNGNLIDGGSANNAEYTLPENQRRFEWDYRNRLRKVYNNAGTPSTLGDDTLIAEYFYDGANRRVRKEVIASGQTDYYLHGWQEIEEYNSSGTESLLQQYVYGIYIDEPLVMDNRRAGTGGTVAQLNDGSGAQRHFYHQNTIYNVYGLTTETGTLAEKYIYDAYGRHYTSTGGSYSDAGTSSVNNSNLYTGRRFDDDTKLIYYRHRYYSTLRGVFINRDPIGYYGSMHIYAYAKNRPSFYTDSYGLSEESVTKVFGGIPITSYWEVNNDHCIISFQRIEYPESITIPVKWINTDVTFNHNVTVVGISQPSAIDCDMIRVMPKYYKRGQYITVNAKTKISVSPSLKLKPPVKVPGEGIEVPLPETDVTDWTDHGNETISHTTKCCCPKTPIDAPEDLEFAKGLRKLREGKKEVKPTPIPSDWPLPTMPPRIGGQPSAGEAPPQGAQP